MSWLRRPHSRSRPLFFPPPRALLSSLLCQKLSSPVPTLCHCWEIVSRPFSSHGAFPPQATPAARLPPNTHTTSQSDALSPAVSSELQTRISKISQSAQHLHLRVSDATCPKLEQTRASPSHVLAYFSLSFSARDPTFCLDTCASYNLGKRNEETKRCLRVVVLLF